MVNASSVLCNEFQERSGYKLEFPRNILVAPHDIVLEHQERYQYANKGTSGTATSWVYTRSKTRSVLYHANNDCVIKRHPYFPPERIQISSQITLRTSHKKLLKDHFDLNIHITTIVLTMSVVNINVNLVSTAA